KSRGCDSDWHFVEAEHCTMHSGYGLENVEAMQLRHFTSNEPSGKCVDGHRVGTARLSPCV
ncbi:hypothetical protein Csa_010571, partial [Cucumis sativus]